LYDYRTGVRWARRIKVRIAHPPQFGPAVSILSHSGWAKSTPNGWNYGQHGYLYTTTNTNLFRLGIGVMMSAVRLSYTTTRLYLSPAPTQTHPTQTHHTNQHKFFRRARRVRKSYADSTKRPPDRAGAQCARCYALTG